MVAITAPRPCVPEPNCRQEPQVCFLWPPIYGSDLDEDVFASSLCIFGENIEIAALIENSRIEQFILEVTAVSLAVFLNNFRGGKLSLRVLVHRLHVRVCRRGIQVEVVLLDVFSMVAFVAGETEQTLLEDGIAAVPHGRSEADKLMAIRDAHDAVLAPSIRARASMVMRKKVPGGSGRAVVFTDRAPLPLRKIWAPAFPMNLAFARFF